MWKYIINFQIECRKQRHARKIWWPRDKNVEVPIQLPWPFAASPYVCSNWKCTNDCKNILRNSMHFSCFCIFPILRIVVLSYNKKRIVQHENWMLAYICTGAQLYSANHTMTRSLDKALVTRSVDVHRSSLRGAFLLPFCLTYSHKWSAIHGNVLSVSKPKFCYTITGRRRHDIHWTKCSRNEPVLSPMGP